MLFCETIRLLVTFRNSQKFFETFDSMTFMLQMHGTSWHGNFSTLLVLRIGNLLTVVPLTLTNAIKMLFISFIYIYIYRFTTLIARFFFFKIARFMGPTWGPGGPYVRHVNLAIWVVHIVSTQYTTSFGLGFIFCTRLRGCRGRWVWARGNFCQRARCLRFKSAAN